MILHVEEAEYLGEYRVSLRFNDGTSGEVDLQRELRGTVFNPLRDTDLFKNFKVEGHTLAWPNGADFAPEFLKKLMQEQSQSAA